MTGSKAIRFFAVREVTAITQATINQLPPPPPQGVTDLEEEVLFHPYLVQAPYIVGFVHMPLVGTSVTQLKALLSSNYCEQILDCKALTSY